MDYQEIQHLLGSEAENLLAFNSPKISKDLLHKPYLDPVDGIFALSNRNPQGLRSLSALYNHGRLAHTRLPVDSPR